ncbi:MAG TPA: NADH-quinone oxidoreductase subunit L [Acidimicrobiales bacterium]|nr:NADH-quinone oxidoreductase subunit L [Acidimicrobiales bacterium]
MLENIWLIPAVTAASFFLILFFGKKEPNKGATIGVLALGLAFAFSSIAAFQWISRPADMEVSPAHRVATAESDEGAGSATDAADEEHATAESEGGEEHHAEPIRRPVERRWEWFNNGQIKVSAGTTADGLAVALCFVVSLISLLVHIFSFSYVHGDSRFTHYYAALSLFTTGMFVLVTSSNTLQALFGWELMGLCSFMLIGHWWDRDGNKNSNAALKAFFTTRTGDVGLLVGISILFFAAGETFDIQRINDAALGGHLPHGVLLAAAAALLVAVIGKSAQFPLHTWLPDAMAGPTPVSALIHAATMVVAGVYLLARLYGVFWEAFDIGGGGINPVAVVGGTTILIAAALAFVQRDIKKVLAYSTVSQLGYMVMALGVGAWTAGIFHLFTHAFFKACLFLGAGSVSHSGSHHSFDMIDDMGGLKDKMPWTFRTFLVATAALSGFPLLAGFWSKDEILLGAGENGYRYFQLIGMLGAAMTAAYMTRCVYLTFFGEPRGAAAHHHPHESPPLIVVPLQILAFMSVVVGFLNFPGLDLFTEWTTNATVLTAGIAHHEFDLVLAVVSTLIAGGGFSLASVYWFRGVRFPITAEGAGKPVYKLLSNKYYLDDLYEGVVVRGIREPISNGAYWINQHVIDGVVNGVGVAARGLARFVYEIIDQKGVDGLVNGAGLSAEGSGNLLRHIQTGRVQQYAALMLGAVGVFAVALVLL